MDIVYVIGTGSKWNNNELKYSFRSICRFGQHLGDVYIVGDLLPDFIDPDTVHFLRVKDMPEVPAAISVGHKIACAFSHFNLEQFLLSSDDHFFIKPVDFDRWPVHYKGHQMPDESQLWNENIGSKQYRQAMVDTRRFMKRLGLDTKYYEGHTNKLYTLEAWKYINSFSHDFIDIVSKAKYGISMNSPMAATIMKMHPEYPCIGRRDVKLRHLNTPEDWEQLQGTESFSIYDSAIKTGVAGLLQVLFPDKCRFEK